MRLQHAGRCRGPSPGLRQSCCRPLPSAAQGQASPCTGPTQPHSAPISVTNSPHAHTCSAAATVSASVQFTFTVLCNMPACQPPGASKCAHQRTTSSPVNHPHCAGRIKQHDRYTTQTASNSELQHTHTYISVMHKSCAKCMYRKGPRTDCRPLGCLAPALLYQPQQPSNISSHRGQAGRQQGGLGERPAPCRPSARGTPAAGKAVWWRSERGRSGCCCPPAAASSWTSQLLAGYHVSSVPVAHVEHIAQAGAAAGS
jgi:hypothetical protein